MLRVILQGASGHMGHVMRDVIKEDAELMCVAGIDMMPDPDAPFPIYDSPASVTEEADVIIDFSTARATDALLSFAVERKLPLVLCTTGLSEEQLAAVGEAAKEIPLLKSANMSLGINTIARLAAEAAKILTEAGFDVEIEEMHHRRKLDAPSGTALLLADDINEACGGDMEYVFDRSSRREARPAREIGISSLRGGTVPGDHTVIFAGQDEVIRISHSAYSRAIFAKGAAAAAKFVATKPAGLYTMKDVIA